MKGLSIGITGSDRFLVGDLQSREALAKKVATSEIDHLFVADHISFHTGFGMDALINAATLSAMLPEMTIVTGVYLLALRHPVPVARQLSSLSLSAHFCSRYRRRGSSRDGNMWRRSFKKRSVTIAFF